MAFVVYYVFCNFNSRIMFYILSKWKKKFFIYNVRKKYAAEKSYYHVLTIYYFLRLHSIFRILFCFYVVLFELFIITLLKLHV